MKKRIILGVMLSIFSIGVFAQDVIVKRDGSTILSKIIEIGTTTITYKKWHNLNGPIYNISQDNVQSINYENGEKDIFEDEITTKEENTSNQKKVTLPKGTIIPLQNINAVRAARVKVGANVPFKVSRDIVIDGVTVIPFGTTANGVVYQAKRSTVFGTKGRLGIRIDQITSPDGMNIPLEGNVYVTGTNRTTLSILMFLFVTWPAMFISGTRAELPAGYEIQAIVGEEDSKDQLSNKELEVSLQNNIMPRNATIETKSGIIDAENVSVEDGVVYYSKPNSSSIYRIKESKVKKINYKN